MEHSTKLKINTIKNCDRFIPLRLSIDRFNDCEQNIDEILINNINSPHSTIQFLNLAKIRYNRINYQNLLRSILFPIEYRTLNFFPPKKRKTTLNPFNNNAQSWPIKARKKPIIGPPTCIFDMPQIGGTSSQILDWSATNWLAVIFENEIHMCCYERSNVLNVTKTGQRVDSYVKWNENGDKLAITLKFSRIGIWDFHTNKIIHETPSCCSIICIKWYFNNLITLCENGTICLKSDKLKTIKTKKLKHDDVGNMEISCKKNYLVTIGISNNNVKVWKIPEFLQYCHIKTNSIVRCAAWHPWKETLLAIGNNKLSLWNIQNNQKQCEEDDETNYEDRIIDSLTFNPKSAELVMNCRIIKHDMPTERSVMSVLTNINSVVEELYFHQGRILHLLWGPRFNTLASAGIDENICVWEFFNTNCNKTNNNPFRRF